MVFGVVLGRKDSAILPAQVANHSARFGLSCPLTELAITMVLFTVQLQVTLKSI